MLQTASAVSSMSLYDFPLSYHKIILVIYELNDAMIGFHDTDSSNYAHHNIRSQDEWKTNNEL